MQNTTMKIKAIWRRLSSKEYRDAYVEETINNRLAAQIYSLRVQRGYTQTDLCDLTGMKQPRISALEKSCRGVTLKTLRRLASAFDVALVVKFVPFSELIKETAGRRIDHPIPKFPDDTLGLSEFRISEKSTKSGHIDLTITSPRNKNIFSADEKPNEKSKSEHFSFPELVNSPEQIEVNDGI